jgi:hypothetical protein
VIPIPDRQVSQRFLGYQRRNSTRLGPGRGVRPIIGDRMAYFKGFQQRYLFGRGKKEVEGMTAAWRDMGRKVGACLVERLSKTPISGEERLRKRLLRRLTHAASGDRGAA